MEPRRLSLGILALTAIVDPEDAVELAGEGPIFVELALGDAVDVEGDVESKFGEGGLELFEVESVLIFVLRSEDDPRGKDAAGGVEVDEAAVGFPITQLLDAAADQPRIVRPPATDEPD